MIEMDHPEISVVIQADLLGINRKNTIENRNIFKIVVNIGLFAKYN